MYKDFKRFILRGNTIDLSIAVVVGAAFAKAVNGITDIIISPLVGIISGSGQFFKDRYGNLSEQNAAGLTANEVMEKLAISRYGELAIDIVNFIVVAFIAFLIARWFGKYFRSVEVAAPPTKSEELLIEIRDLLKQSEIYQRKRNS
jgi:large conductance mechanosensitive channel